MELLALEAQCGDEMCNGGETCASCAADCGACGDPGTVDCTRSPFADCWASFWFPCWDPGGACTITGGETASILAWQNGAMIEYEFIPEDPSSTHVTYTGPAWIENCDQAD